MSALAYARALRGRWGSACEAIARIAEPGYFLQDATFYEHPAKQSLALVDGYADGWLDPDRVGELFGAAPTADTGFDIAFLSSLCTQVEVAEIAQAPELIAGVPAAIERARTRGSVIAFGWPFVLRRIEGVAATLEGRWSDAQEHFESALELTESLRAGPEQCRTALDYARMLLRRSEPGDREHAAELVGAFLPAIRVHCADPFTTRAEKLAAYLTS
jgi:hypothetical protein